MNAEPLLASVAAALAQARLERVDNAVLEVLEATLREKSKG